MTLKLSMTCGPYDRAGALIDGSVKPEGIDLSITVNDDDVERQRQAVRGDFDVCEFFTGTYIADLPFKKLGFTAIPIFVKRMFRHSYIYINKRSGIRKPSDLNGRRVGVQTWITSAALWAKGMLE
jgi:4,5-dihydroxyphthalate decarboxylase